MKRVTTEEFSRPSQDRLNLTESNKLEEEGEGEDTETLAEEERRGSGRRGDSRRRLELQEIQTESLSSESNEGATESPEREFSTIKLDGLVPVTWL